MDWSPDDIAAAVWFGLLTLWAIVTWIDIRKGGMPK